MYTIENLDIIQQNNGDSPAKQVAIHNPLAILLQSQNTTSIGDIRPAKYRTRPASRAVRRPIATGLQDRTGIAMTTNTQPPQRN